MLNFREPKFVPGFRVRDPEDDVLGFRGAPDDFIRRSATNLPSYGSSDSDLNRWFSGLLDTNDRFATNPHLRGDLTSQIGQAGQYLNEWGSERRGDPFFRMNSEGHTGGAFASNPIPGFAPLGQLQPQSSDAREAWLQGSPSVRPDFAGNPYLRLLKGPMDLSRLGGARDDERNPFAFLQPIQRDDALDSSVNVGNPIVPVADVPNAINDNWSSVCNRAYQDCRYAALARITHPDVRREALQECQQAENFCSYKERHPETIGRDGDFAHFPFGSVVIFRQGRHPHYVPGPGGQPPVTNNPGDPFGKK